MPFILPRQSVFVDYPRHCRQKYSVGP